MCAEIGYGKNNISKEMIEHKRSFEVKKGCVYVVTRINRRINYDSLFNIL